MSGYVKGSKEYRNTSIAMLAAGVTTFIVMYFAQGLLPEFSRAFDISPSRASLSLSLTTVFFGCLDYSYEFALAKIWQIQIIKICDFVRLFNYYFISFCAKL
ncbi:MAG: hypothetical protein N4Q30_00365 [Neisseriaceae bacterium]|nr:hypothetical protein [Neisseriaceae bacterium]